MNDESHTKVVMERLNICLNITNAGIVVTVKQRQEFRIRLQKRARRAAERKLDSFEEERLIRTVIAIWLFLY